MDFSFDFSSLEFDFSGQKKPKISNEMYGRAIKRGLVYV